MAHAQPTNVTVRTDGRFEVGRRLKEDFQSGPPLLRDGKPLLMPYEAGTEAGSFTLSSSLRDREGLADLLLGQAELAANSAWRHTGLERRSDRIHLARGQCRCLTDFLLTRLSFPWGCRRIGLRWPYRVRWHRSSTPFCFLDCYPNQPV